MGSYFDPVRYEGPNRRSLPPWVAPTIAALILLGGLLGLRGALYHQPTSRARKLPPVLVGKAAVGTQWKWHVLDMGAATLPFQSGKLGGFVAGNFDKDPDQELLLIGPGKGYVYDMDGTRTPVGIHGPEFIMSVAAWDYDADGIDEIVPESILYNVVISHPTRSSSAPSLPTTTPVIALSGAKLADLSGTTDPGGGGDCADVDADGKPELLLNTSSRSWVAYGAQGKVIATYNHVGSFIQGFGDIDNDGRAEALTLENRGKDLVAYSLGGKRIELGAVPSTAAFQNVADVDADGKADLLFGGVGYLNCRQGFISYAYSQPSNAGLAHSTVGDYLGTGSGQVALLPASSTSVWSSDLMLFDQAGKILYAERFGKPVPGLATVHAGGKDYLVLQMIDRIIVHP